MKQKRIAAENVLLPSPPPDELLDEGMHVCANLTTHRHSERNKGVGGGELAPILVFLPLTASVRCFPAWRAAFSRLELA